MNGHDQKMSGHPNPLEALRPSRRRMIGLAAVGTVGALAAMATGGRPASAVGSTVMTVNPRTATADINAWLAVGGVRVLTGATVLSGPLVIPSGTQLDASSASITGAIGDNVLRNASAIPTATTTASVRAGSAAVTTKAAVFSAASVGRAVQVLGAGPRAGKSTAPGSMYGRIVSVQSSTRATLSVPATGTVTAATTYLFPPDDSDISISGGTWTNRSKNSLSQTTESHGLYIRRAARVSLSGMTVHSTGSSQTGGQYAVSFADVTDVTVEDIAFIDTASDGVHFQGPASKLAIRRITGERTGDDLVAFTTVDGQTHAGSRLGDCEGDITDVVVEDVQGKACLCLLKVTSGIGANGVQRRIRRFSASGFSGTVTGRFPIAIVDYAGPTWFEGTISGVSAIGAGGTAVQVDVGTLGALVVEDVTAPAGSRAAVDGIVRVAAKSASSVTVNRVTNRSVAAGTASGVALAIGSVATVAVSGVACPVLAPQFDSVRLVRASSTITKLTVSNDTSAARNGNVFAVAPAAKGYRIANATFSGISRSTGSVWSAEADSTVSTTMTVSGFKGGRAVAVLRAPAKITVQGLVQPAGSGGGLRLNSAAASPVRAVIDGTSSRSATLVARTGSQKVSVVSPFIAVDAALLTPLDGDVVLNSGGKYATSQLRWSAKAKRWQTTKVARPTPTPAPAPAATPKPSAPAPSAPATPAPTASASPTPTPTQTQPSPSVSPSDPTPTVAPTPTDAPSPTSTSEPALVP